MGCAGALCNGPSAALLPTAKRTQSGGSTRFHEAFPCHFQDRYVRLRSVSRKKLTPGSVRTGKPHKVSLKVLADSLELSPATVSLKTRCEVLHNGLGSGKGKPHEIEYSLID